MVDPTLLEGLPLLSGASPNQLSRLAARLDSLRVEAGTVLAAHGDTGDFFWLIRSGEVRVEVPGRAPLQAGPGSVLGELALLRHRPRTATVTAVTDTVALVGDHAGLEALLEIDGARRALRQLSSRRLAEDLRPVPLALRDGTTIHLRPLLPEDRDALDDAVHHLSAESIRRRFFSSSPPTSAVVEHLVNIDYVDHFAWAALNPVGHHGVGTGRYVRTPGADEAEVAFTTTDEWQGRGLGTVLLGAVGVAATEAGVNRLKAFVLEDNRAMRAVFAKASGSASYAEPGVLEVSMPALAAAFLLGDESRERLAGAVHDIVTAASLALRA